ncbi:MAG: alpha/beta fold hydrolase [Pseudobdellovibrionaceae bacterium]
MSETRSFLLETPHSSPLTLVASVWGDPTHSPLICVHGLTGNGQDFDYIGPELAKLGYYVVAPDMIGRARSDYVDDPDLYRYTVYLSHLNQIMDVLNVRPQNPCVWLGVSMGGLLGVYLAGEESPRISRLILDDIGPHVPQEDLDLISQFLSGRFTYPSFEVMKVAFSQKAPRFDRGPMDDAQFDHFVRVASRPLEDGTLTHNFDWEISRMFAAQPLGDTPLWPRWEAFEGDVLALRGEYSTLFPPEVVEEMARRKKAGSFTCIEIPKCGHVPSLYRDDQIKIVTDWLEKG